MSVLKDYQNELMSEAAYIRRKRFLRGVSVSKLGLVAAAIKYKEQKLRKIEAK